MAFELDVFISYAHIDNMPLKEGDKGWVENFHRALDVRLAQLMGEKARIWRDKKLQGNDFFGDEIIQQFPKTALMISILSPRYLKSEWCTREIKSFYKTASEGQGTRIGNKSRIFKIIKTAVPFDAHPSEIVDTLGYDFFIADADTGKTKELSDKAPGDLEQLYWAKLDDIAHDISNLLSQLDEPGTTAAPPPAEQLTVYLAETTSDLKEQRDMIKRQLTEYGYRIVPDTQLSFEESEFDRGVNDFLAQSALSVHLVGSSYGLVPEGSEQSIIMKQNQLAAQASKTGALQRLIWLLAENGGNDERQKEFINLLRTSPDAQYGADLFETSIEDFKTSIRDKLKSLQTGKVTGGTPFQTISTVFLAEVNHELREVRERIKERLMERGCEVLPEEPLPLVYHDLKEKLNDISGRCDVSVHFLGDHYSVVPEEAEKSLPYIEIEHTDEKSKTGQLERLVWISPHIADHSDERQEEFLGFVRKNTAEHPHTDVFESSFDEMEPLTFEKLEAIEKKRQEAAKAAADKTPSPGNGEADQGPRLIYLICDREDLENQDNEDLNKLEDFLFDSGFEVVLPVFEGEEADVLDDHHENLRTCDAVIIYYGSGRELWMRSISRDLSKIAGYGRDRPLLAKSVFIGPPSSRPKQRFRSHDMLVINGLDGFSPEVMEPFVQPLK